MDTAGASCPQIWTPFGHCRAVGAPYLNARALCLNGQAILYSPPGTGKTRQYPIHPHVCVWKVSMAPSKPTLPSNQAFVVQFRTRPCGAPSWGGRVEHLASYHKPRQNIVYLSAELNRLCRIRVSTDISIRDLSPVDGLILPLYSVVAHRNATPRVQSIYFRTSVKDPLARFVIWR